nr:helix-turn-helix transcriptional regulator [Nitrosomonas nitrosa]
MGAALAAVRKGTGLTQVALSKRLKKPQSFVSSYECGQRRLDLLEFIRIVDELGGDPDAVFRDVLRLRRSEGDAPSNKVIRRRRQKRED